MDKSVEVTNIQGRCVRNLFRAVICRAVQDAIFVRSKTNKYDKYEKSHAIAWLCGEFERDLRFVCECAGVSADRIIKVSKKIFANGSPDLSRYEDIKNLKRLMK